MDINWDQLKCQIKHLLVIIVAFLYKQDTRCCMHLSLAVGYLKEFIYGVICFLHNVQKDLAVCSGDTGINLK